MLIARKQNGININGVYADWISVHGQKMAPLRLRSTYFLSLWLTDGLIGMHILQHFPLMVYALSASFC